MVEAIGEGIEVDAAAVPATVDGAMLELLVALRQEQDRLEAELIEVKARAGEVSAVLQEQFIAAGVRSVKAESGATVYLEHKTYYSVSPIPGEDKSEAEQRMARAMEDAGLSVLVRHKVALDLKGLAEHLREQDEVGAPVDARLTSSLTASEVFALKVRRRG